MSLSKRKCLTIALLFFIAVVVFNLVTIENNISDSGKKKNKENKFLPLTDDDISAISRGITLSREYQMKLFASNFTQRETGLNKFLADVSKILDIPEIQNLSQGYETVRLQRVFNTQVCGKRFNPRVRNYFTGYRAGTSSIDIKSGTTGHEGPTKVLEKVYEPTANFTNDSEIKFEWDVHPCKVKYSLESRIYLQYQMELHTCEELANMFVRVAKRVPEPALKEKISIDDLYTTWIYEIEHHGKLSFGDTEFKTSATFLYNSKEDAISGTSQPTDPPEWSIRLWSTDHGKNRWIKKTLNYINTKYFKLLQYFGSPDLPCSGTFPSINETLRIY